MVDIDYLFYQANIGHPAIRQDFGDNNKSRIVGCRKHCRFSNITWRPLPADRGYVHPSFFKEHGLTLKTIIKNLTDRGVEHRKKILAN